MLDEELLELAEMSELEGEGIDGASFKCFLGGDDSSHLSLSLLSDKLKVDSGISACPPHLALTGEWTSVRRQVPDEMRVISLTV